MSDIDLPEVPALDERRIKWARRRAVVRIGFALVLWVVFGSVVLQVLNGVWLDLGDRQDRFGALAGDGYGAAHPELRVAGSGCCNLGLLPGRASALREEQVWTAGGDGPNLRFNVRRQLDGDLSVPYQPALDSVPLTRVAGSGSPPSKEATRTLLDELPPAVRLLAVVGFTDPLDEANQTVVDERYGEPLLFTGQPYLTDPYASSEEGTVTWAARELDAFEDFAGRWNEDDDANLRAVGLPPSEELRALAEEPRIRAVATELTPGEARRLLDDDLVASVHVADVAFAVQGL